MLATNQVLNKGRYRIINSFIQDETGGTYEAFDTISNTKVLVRESVGRLGKVTTSNQLDELNAAFAGGAKALKEARHESLVSVHDYFSEIDRQYLVLEAMTGSDLTKYLSPEEARPELAEVLSWMDQLLNALNYLHKLSPPVIHADIRPQNIKLTTSRKVKLLTDRVTIPIADNRSKASTGWIDDTAVNYRPLEAIWAGLNETSQRVILNSYDERSAGILLRAPDARSDIYSIAATFYHVLTGRVPADALDRSIAILDGEPDTLQRPADLDSSIPSEISDALMRAMALRRENRFDSAIILLQVLRTAMARTKERTSGDVLDLGGTEADERQREIESEQAKLEEERIRIERRQLELESEKEGHAAERNRLKIEAEKERKQLEKEKLEQEAEMERQRIAELLADLDARRTREREEEERLEREAEAERRRAEERLHEIQAEQERHRAEQHRMELKAKEELERAERRLMELSGANLDIIEPNIESRSNDDGDELLELPSETRGSAEMGTNVFGPYEENAVVPNFYGQQGYNWRLPLVVGAAAVLLLGAVVGWNMLSVEQRVPAAAQQVAVPVEERVIQTAPESVPQIVPEETNVTTSVEPAYSPPGESGSFGSGPKRVQSQLSPVQERPKKPAAEKPAATKKQVTVDDLINDN